MNKISKQFAICAFVIFFRGSASGIETLTHKLSFDEFRQYVRAQIVEKNDPSISFKIEGSNHIFTYNPIRSDNHNLFPWHEAVDKISEEKSIIQLKEYLLIRVNLHEGKSIIHGDRGKVKLAKYVESLPREIREMKICFLIICSKDEKIGSYLNSLLLIDSISSGRYVIEVKE